MYNLKPILSLDMYLPFVFQYVHSFHIYMTYAMLNYQSCMSSSAPCMYLCNKDVFKKCGKRKDFVFINCASGIMKQCSGASVPWLLLLLSLRCSNPFLRYHQRCFFLVCLPFGGFGGLMFDVLQQTFTLFHTCDFSQGKFSLPRLFE